VSDSRIRPRSLSGTKNIILYRKKVQFAKKLEVMNVYIAKLLFTETNRTKPVKNRKKSNHCRGHLKYFFYKNTDLTSKQKQQGRFECYNEWAGL
jgi:hypothetical protein